MKGSCSIYIQMIYSDKLKTLIQSRVNVNIYFIIVLRNDFSSYISSTKKWLFLRNEIYIFSQKRKKFWTINLERCKSGESRSLRFVKKPSGIENSVSCIRDLHIFNNEKRNTLYIRACTHTYAKKVHVHVAGVEGLLLELTNASGHSTLSATVDCKSSFAKAATLDFTLIMILKRFDFHVKIKYVTHEIIQKWYSTKKCMRIIVAQKGNRFS